MLAWTTPLMVKVNLMCQLEFLFLAHILSYCVLQNSSSSMARCLSALWFILQTRCDCLQLICFLRNMFAQSSSCVRGKVFWRWPMSGWPLMNPIKSCTLSLLCLLRARNALWLCKYATPLWVNTALRKTKYLTSVDSCKRIHPASSH